MPLWTGICATTPPVGCWMVLTLDCTTRLPGTTTAPDNGTSVIQPPANPPTTSSARKPVRNSPSKARAARTTMLSPGAPATSADPSRLARNATPAVRPLRTTPVTERSRGTGPAGLGGANWGASMRGGSRVSSIGKTSGRDLGMFMSDGSSGAMIGPRACRSFRQEFAGDCLPKHCLPGRACRSPVAGP